MWRPSSANWASWIEPAGIVKVKLLRSQESIEARSWESFDLLATMVAVVNPDGSCLYANAG